MQVAVKPEDVASSGEIVGQAQIAVATPQDRLLYEVMSVTPSNYPHIRSKGDIGASETMQRWAWSEHGGTGKLSHNPRRHICWIVHTSAPTELIRQIVDGIPHL